MRRFIRPLAMLLACTAGEALAATVGHGTSPVSDERLARTATSEDGAWLTYGRDRGASHFSPLRLVDARDVGGLRPAWTATLSDPVSLEGTPLVDGDVMYATTGKDAVIALDARTGKTLWRYDYPLPGDVNWSVCCNFDNRGVALANDLVVIGTLDAHLVALDRATGAVRWNVPVAEYHRGYSITSAPLLVGDTIVTGIAGSEYPIRGFLAAYDVRTGAQRWRTPTVGPQRLGGSTWVQGSYDESTHTLFWGVGNPNPDYVPPRTRAPGDYSDSLLALDPSNGRIKWAYHYMPWDMWDYDGVNEPILVDVRRGNRIVHAIAHADRNGYLYLIDRTDGRLIYAQPFVDRVTWGGIDRDGRVHLNRAMIDAFARGKPIVFYPSATGGKNWGPAALDPDRAVLFVASIEAGGTLARAPLVEPPSANPFDRIRHALGNLRRMLSGLPAEPARFSVGGYHTDLTNEPAYGYVSAYDLASGRCLWRTRVRTPLVGGLLATAGGLVFGGSPEGALLAFDARTGRLVWQGKTTGGITAPPMTYVVDGRQFVAVEVGIGGVLPIFHQDAMPAIRTVPPTSTVDAFALPDARLGRR
jgi:alcohol dehydrogenase (cytochrome c)